MVTVFFLDYETGSSVLSSLKDLDLSCKVDLHVFLCDCFGSENRHFILYKFYVLGQIGLSKQCRPRSDCF